MTVLGLLLLSNAVLHGVIIGRFGIKGNVPPAVFGVLYAGLALVVFRGWDRAGLAALVVTMVGLLGLALSFKTIQHDRTVERIVFGVGSATIAYAAFLLVLR